MIVVRYRVRSLIFEYNLKISNVLLHFFHVFILKNLEFSAESFGPTVILMTTVWVIQKVVATSVEDVSKWTCHTLWIIATPF